MIGKSRTLGRRFQNAISERQRISVFVWCLKTSKHNGESTRSTVEVGTRRGSGAFKMLRLRGQHCHRDTDGEQSRYNSSLFLIPAPP